MDPGNVHDYNNAPGEPWVAIIHLNSHCWWTNTA